MSTPGPDTHAVAQEAAFAELCDMETSRLKAPIRSKHSCESIKKLNRATAKSTSLIAKVKNYAIGTTLCQGACLLVAVFWQLAVMVPTWCGPPADLGRSSVHILASYPGTQKQKVRIHGAWCC